MRGTLVPVLLLVLLVCCQQAAGQGYQASFSSAASGRAQGSVLLLDVSSLWKKHPTQPAISTQDAGECQRRCAKLPGCTAYSFCKDPSGCGTGCSAHVGKNPGVSAITLESQVAPKRGERDMVPSSFKIPLNSFGPYTPNTATKGCAAAAPDKWAFGTCTLLKAAGPNKLASAAEGAGWVSAWLTSPPPASCNGLSATACAACAASPDPTACLSCMTDKRALGYIDPVSLVGDGQAGGSLGSRTLDQCMSCSKLGSKGDQAKCIKCVLEGEACATCIPYPGSATILAPAAQGPCMSCVEAKGKRFMGSCVTCATSSDASKCIKCLDNFFPRMICTTSEYKNCYKPDFDNPCAACAKVSAANYDACISCFSKPTAKVDCESCSALQSPTAQSTCFTCNAKNPTKDSNTPGGCGLCFSRSKNTASLNQCVSCLTDETTTPEKRKVCSMCSSSELSGEQSARCFSCLEGKSGNSGCSVCSTAATTGPAFDSCMSCHSNSVNGPDCHECNSLGNNVAPTARDALRKQCWDCVVASKLVVPDGAGSAPLGSCSSCFASSSTNQKACVACNTNPLVPTVAKSWCVACAIKAAGQQESCVKCLGANKLTNTGDYRTKCSI